MDGNALIACFDIGVNEELVNVMVINLDALDAYNQKLVKEIAVRGIAVKGLSGTNAYLYLESMPGMIYHNTWRRAYGQSKNRNNS